MALPRLFGRPAAFFLALVALIGFGAGEWVREAIRKPYVIHGYLYPTGLRPDESEALPSRGGVIANALWVENDSATPDAGVGKDVFRVACRSCHTLDGYNGLREPLQGLDEDYLYELIGRLPILRGGMSPFPGTDVERRALAKYLTHEAGEKVISEGREVFEKRCGFCHTEQGFRSLQTSLEGYTREDILDLLPLLGDMTDEMAPWSGTDEEADLLADFVLSWYPTGSGSESEEN
jgi:mono/diheme cytochrome c family protein